MTDNLSPTDVLEGRNPRRIRLNLETLRNECILIDRSVHGIGGKLTKRSTTDAERAASGLRQQLQTAGTTLNLPAEHVKALRSIAVGYYNMVDEMSYDGGLVGVRNYRAIPIATFPRFLERFENHRERMRQVVDAIVDSLEEFREQRRAQLIELSEQSWAQLWATNEGGQLEVDGNVYDHNVAGFNDFREYVIDTGLANIPDEELIRTSIYIEWRPAIIENRLEVLEARLQEMQAEAMIREQRHQDAVRYRERAEELAQVRNVVRDRIREVLTEDDDPVQLAVQELRRRIADKATKVAAAIDKNGYIPGASAGTLAGMIRLYEEMKIADDPTLDSHMENLLKLTEGGIRRSAAPGINDTLKAMVASFGFGAEVETEQGEVDDGLDFETDIKKSTLDAISAIDGLEF